MYIVKLGDVAIAHTELEFSDPPMGVVFGDMKLMISGSFFLYLSGYVEQNGIQMNLHDVDGMSISTRSISELRIYSREGVLIEGAGAYIEGADSDGYQVSIFGVPYPFYEEQFPHHVKKYKSNHESRDA